METESDFGKGYSYCLGLFLAHTFMFEDVIKKEYLSYGIWFNGAGDHIFEFEAKTDREIAFKDRVLHHRLETATKEDFEWAIREAKDLLMEYDRKNGFEVIKGNYE